MLGPRRTEKQTLHSLRGLLVPCVSCRLHWPLGRSSRESPAQQGESGQHLSCPFSRPGREAGPRPQAAQGRQE